MRTFVNCGVCVEEAGARSSMELSCMQRDCEEAAWSKKLHRVLCMQGGDDEQSYAKNSEAPASAVALSMPLLKEAIESMKLFRGEKSIRIADLGCATGHNTLSTVQLVVDSLRTRYEEECCDHHHNDNNNNNNEKEEEEMPEFEAFFSDLPSNDFNSLFRSLPSFYGKKKTAIFVAGVPGSFYKRLFPRGQLHLVVSLSALHWLSEVD